MATEAGGARSKASSSSRYRRSPNHLAAAASPAGVSRSARSENGMAISAPQPKAPRPRKPPIGSSFPDDEDDSALDEEDDDESDGAITTAAAASRAGAKAPTPRATSAGLLQRLRLRPWRRASATTAFWKRSHHPLDCSSGPVVSASHGTTPSDASP